MDFAEEERLRCLIDSVEKEERDRYRNFRRDQLAARRQLYSENEQNEDFTVLDEENEVDCVEQFFENTDSEVEIIEEIPVHQSSEVQPREETQRAGLPEGDQINIPVEPEVST
uniref:Uncharacterized protein n=1 Tax=Homalodisca liturata TaxID=320908 RepID=A0A1B6HTL7_9HEMI